MDLVTLLAGSPEGLFIEAEILLAELLDGIRLSRQLEAKLLLEETTNGVFADTCLATEQNNGDTHRRSPPASFSKLLRYCHQLGWKLLGC